LLGNDLVALGQTAKAIKNRVENLPPMSPPRVKWMKRHNFSN